MCAVAELFESEVLGTQEEGDVAEEAPVKTVKPKTGKAALLLKRDRVGPLSAVVSLIMMAFLESVRPTDSFRLVL